MEEKFTEQEVALLEEMVDYPDAYGLTPHSFAIVKGLYEKLVKLVY